MNARPLLDVKDLRTAFVAGDRRVDAVRGVDFSIFEEESLGLIGESGSGKTVTGLTVLRLLPEHARATATTLRFRDFDLTSLDDEALRRLRGVEMAMIFQDPVGSFNPAKTIGWHLRQAVARRAPEQARGWREEATALLADVGIRQTGRVLSAYPHELSGGMLQRALIAMVIALRPALIIADEPTTNLDNLVERQILDLIRLHQKRLKASVLFITHDLAIAEDVCDRIAVMYAGEIVEIGSADAVLRDPKHPYAQGLLETSRSLERRDEYLFELKGEPGGRIPAQGCAFAPRCPLVMPRCRLVHPRMVAAGADREARCLLYGE